MPLRSGKLDIVFVNKLKFDENIYEDCPEFRHQSRLKLTWPLLIMNLAYNALSSKYETYTEI